MGTISVATRQTGNDSSAGSHPSHVDRFRGAIWGQLVGDAACLGSHWIYDLGELARIYPEGLAGFEAPAKGHYHHGKFPGDQTHYGDAALLLLRSVAELGRFDAADFGRRFVALMESPEYTGYRDHASRGTVANYHKFLDRNVDGIFDFQQGADDDQPATATRLAPVVVSHYRDNQLLHVTSAATKVCQDNDRAVAYMKCHALILKELFNGQALVAAIQGVGEEVAAEPAYGPEIVHQIGEALDFLPLSVPEVTVHFGQSCPLLHSFPSAIHAAVKYQDDFAAAVLSTAQAGGDSAGRASLIGAWLGAFLGIGGIPEDWRRRLTAYDAIERDVERLVRNLEV